MTPQEKILYHQIHLAKLATDIATSVVSSYFLWVANFTGFWAIFLIPSVIVTALLVRFADLESLKQSAFGHYVARHMTRAVEVIRMGGQILMWIAAWKHAPWGIVAGALVVIGGWVSGLWRRRSV